LTLKQSWVKCRTKNWNLSYECIISEAARYTLQERLDEDSKFALSISDPHVGTFATDEDQSVDGPDFDDDLALSANELARGLTKGTPADYSAEGAVPGFDEDGNFVFHGGLDDELTDDDAEGDTDPEPDICDDEMTADDALREDDSSGPDPASEDSDFKFSVQQRNDAKLDPVSEDDDFEDASIILVQGAELPIHEGRYYLDRPGGRYA
jgi:hypothetical protein